ncbi:SRPBCC family protein [Reyranella sp. CPCC 100927]|uniref:SRPBCC family protein n=1 Tax=Reyranella sp. CPCC 100927 TaxID=2599616 RepID=UPI0011B80954|nr:SRPBCC family protein [Reyranella sp. CPCC 100927]TWT00294.1 polyketide cyclase [Reyranella sp. CPCC 100927]
MTDLTQAPVATAEMLIRKPVAEVFNAFVDPAVTTRFWFTKSSGRLVAGRPVQWTWEMYGFAMTIDVTAIEPDKRIVIDGFGDSTVTWTFTPRADGTYVSISNSGFQGDGDTQVKTAVGSTEGFAFVLAGAKAWLEHGITLNLIADKYPDGLAKT